MRPRASWRPGLTIVAHRHRPFPLRSGSDHLSSAYALGWKGPVFPEDRLGKLLQERMPHGSFAGHQGFAPTIEALLRLVRIVEAGEVELAGRVELGGLGVANEPIEQIDRFRIIREQVESGGKDTAIGRLGLKHMEVESKRIAEHADFVGRFIKLGNLAMRVMANVAFSPALLNPGSPMSCASQQPGTISCCELGNALPGWNHAWASPSSLGSVQKSQGPSRLNVARRSDRTAEWTTAGVASRSRFPSAGGGDCPKSWPTAANTSPLHKSRKDGMAVSPGMRLFVQLVINVAFFQFRRPLAADCQKPTGAVCASRLIMRRV